MEPIRIQVRIGESGLLYADSPDLPGLHAIERTEEELKVTLSELIPLLLKEQGVIATVSSVQSVSSDHPPAWVVAGLKAAVTEKVG